jgi:hypothetical protein
LTGQNINVINIVLKPETEQSMMIELAFAFINGVPDQIVYDQDKVFYRQRKQWGYYSDRYLPKLYP